MSQGVERQDTVTISRSEYDSLVKAEQKLVALEVHGVDNWDGYGDAMASLEPKEEPVTVPQAPVSEPTGQPEGDSTAVS